MSNPIKIINHPNAVKAKLHNKRVTLIKHSKGGYQLTFSIITDNPKPAAIHEHVRGKIRNTTILLTDETTEALLQVLAINAGKQDGLDVSKGFIKIVFKE
jgi:hypothetical protein